MRHYWGMPELLQTLLKWNVQIYTLVSTYTWTTRDEPCWLLRKPVEAIDKQLAYRINNRQVLTCLPSFSWTAVQALVQLLSWATGETEIVQTADQASLSNTCKSRDEFPLPNHSFQCLHRNQVCLLTSQLNQESSRAYFFRHVSYYGESVGEIWVWKREGSFRFRLCCSVD